MSPGWRPGPVGDAAEIVRAGYDAIADRYATWQHEVEGSPRMRYLEALLERLSPRISEGAAERPRILELGCGAGISSSRILAERGVLTGVDISGEQLRRARQRIPDAAFIEADITRVEFPDGAFDAVVAFYVLTHVPSEELGPLLARIHGWLAPGGWFLATMSGSATGDGIEDDWLGVPMFFSGLAPEDELRLVRKAGLEVDEAEIVPQREDGEGEVRFLWVLARKPMPG